jgi:hypothetical protein
LQVSGLDMETFSNIFIIYIQPWVQWYLSRPYESTGDENTKGKMNDDMTPDTQERTGRLFFYTTIEETRLIAQYPEHDLPAQ